MFGFPSKVYAQNSISASLFFFKKLSFTKAFVPDSGPRF